MTPQNLHDKIKALLTERGNKYGNTHEIVGAIINHFALIDTPLFTQTNLIHNWIQMLGKLVRLLFDPANPDHLYDIIGYAIRTLEIQPDSTELFGLGGNNDATD